MSFKHFQDSKQIVKVSNSENDCSRALIYLADNQNGIIESEWDYLHIEIINHKKGKYFLNIERSDWVSDNLELLELKLYEFSIDAGYYSKGIK